MATENETEVKEDETIVPEEGADDVTPDSSQDDKTETDEDDESKDGDDTTAPAPTEPAPKVEIPPAVDGIKRLPDETDREFALRLENKRLREKISGNRGKEIFEAPKPAANAPKKESEVLKKYKPEDVQALREVLPEIASELGYVRQDELNKSDYEKVANAQIEEFIAAHPEYSSEKDPEGILWNKLKEEYQTLYKPPANPKDYKKIFERIHKDIFGIQAKGPLPKDSAAREKIKVASQAGASAAAPTRTTHKASTGLRLDMMKGFSDEELGSIKARAEEE